MCRCFGLIYASIGLINYGCFLCRPPLTLIPCRWLRMPQNAPMLAEMKLCIKKKKQATPELGTNETHYAIMVQRFGHKHWIVSNFFLIQCWTQISLIGLLQCQFCVTAELLCCRCGHLDLVGTMWSYPNAGIQGVLEKQSFCRFTHIHLKQVLFKVCRYFTRMIQANSIYHFFTYTPFSAIKFHET